MSNAFAVLVVGFGVGWLVGLSQSPVIAGAIAALVTAAGALVASLAKVNRQAAAGAEAVQAQTYADLLTPLPLAALVVGVGLGAPFGLYARTAGWFAAAPRDAPPSLEQIVDRWERMGMSRKAVVQRLFERELGIPGTPAGPLASQGAASPVVPAGLVAEGSSAQECLSLRAVGRDRLLLELRSSERPEVRRLANALPDSGDPDLGRLVMEAVCPRER